MLCIHTYTCLVKKWFTTNIDWMRHGSGTKSSKIIRSVAAPLVFITLTEVRKWKEFCQEVEGEFKERKNEPKTKTSEDSYLTVIVEHDKHVFFSILIRFYG